MHRGVEVRDETLARAAESEAPTVSALIHLRLTACFFAPSSQLSALKQYCRARPRSIQCTPQFVLFANWGRTGFDGDLSGLRPHAELDELVKKIHQ